ncbi:MAG: GNAT family N-acetyltransferase [Cyanobacteria bacterium P01_A01_bin.135]
MSNTAIKIRTVAYREATAEIHFVRQRVFQEEQGVSAELEFDGLDEGATHLLAYSQEQAVGTTRMRMLDNATAKIERVAVLTSQRGKGVGRQLMNYAVDYLRGQGVGRIKVNAQLPVKAFYEGLGFVAQGEVFEEAGIPHVTMWL